MAGPRDPADVSTLDVVKVGTASQPGPPRVPALTILLHPDPARIGELARLTALITSGTVLVSRTETEFGQPGNFTRSPLADPVLSRRGLRLAHTNPDHWTVSPGGSAALVDGSPLAKELVLDRAAIERGVVIELAARVVLLLHFIGPPRERGPRMGLIGDSDAIAELRAQIRRVADLAVSVLVRGESGSGKELVARALHDASRCSSGPFVAVNMATVHPSLAASELFGHTRGAFTNASEDHRGYFAQAHGGTLFLDEIGETAPAVQSMLLRVLEVSEIQPLGAAAPRKVDVRLVAATDLDLEAAARAQTFRSPLLHRLSGYVLSVAPLRKRPDDIGRLFIHFVRAELETLGELERLKPAEPGAPPWIPASLVTQLVHSRWPGNVRELRNVARQLVISSRGNASLRVDETLERLLATPRAEAAADARRRHAPSEIGDEELEASLRKHDWKTGAAAEDLGISRTSLYALMEKSPRVRKAADVSAAEIVACHAEKASLDEVAAQLRVSRRGLILRMRQLGIKLE